MMRDEMGRRIGHGIRIFIKVTIFLIIAIAVFGTAVYHLWNWLMPTLFKLPAITFGQGVGLLALSWLLFGFPGRRGRSGGPWRRGMGGRWERMTPEEREKFRELIRGRCGRGPVEAQVKV